MKKNLAFFGKKFQQLCSCSSTKLASFSRSTFYLVVYFYRYVLHYINPFWIQLCYFLSVSFLGYLILVVLKTKTTIDSFSPRKLDLFFTSVSATTVSSMSTVEMEVFSNTQLVVLTILMFIGGEVFTSMVGLCFRMSNLKKKLAVKKDMKVDSSSSPPTVFLDQIELEIVTVIKQHDFVRTKSENDLKSYLKYNSVKFLGLVVFGYLLVVHIFGVTLVSIYLTFISSARDVLKTKGLHMFTFSVFTIVSTFTSCGFVPTNENMMVFSKNSGLLLILIPQVLFGNTLFPSCLRFLIWFLGKFFKKEESDYLLNNTKKIGYLHLLPSLHSSLLVITVFGFVAVQFVLFSSLEWGSDALTGLNSYQKVVGAFFQTVNTRHTGETIVDLSIISPAILVLFVVMMYLPPYTSFLPIKDDEQRKTQKRKMVENVIFSQLTYLAIFIIIICITERKKMKQDPLNFNVLNIVVEVISAYGNVGFTTGYNCKRQLYPDGTCKDKWFGFSGKWSDEGKVVLIMVMFLGRLKKFNMNGGRSWKLL